MPGHIENERFPGQARNSFTLEDLSNGRVSFVHQVSRKILIIFSIGETFMVIQMGKTAMWKVSKGFCTLTHPKVDKGFCLV